MGGHRVKVVVGEETLDALLALVMAFGEFGHNGACQFGDGEGAAAARMARLSRRVTRTGGRWQWIKAAMQ